MAAAFSNTLVGKGKCRKQTARAAEIPRALLHARDNAYFSFVSVNVSKGTIASYGFKPFVYKESTES